MEKPWVQDRTLAIFLAWVQDGTLAIFLAWVQDGALAIFLAWVQDGILAILFVMGSGYRTELSQIVRQNRLTLTLHCNSQPSSV